MDTLDSSVMKKTAADSKTKGKNTGSSRELRELSGKLLEFFFSDLTVLFNMLWRWMRFKFVMVGTIFNLAKDSLAYT